MGWSPRKHKYGSHPLTHSNFTICPLTDWLDTFLSAYSWFEASILRPPSDDSRPTLPKWIKKAINRPVNISAFTDDDFGFTEVRSPYKSKNERWLVQKNLQASRDVRYYEVAWPDPSSGVRDAEPKPEHNEMSGSGRGLEFVETLQAGDRIALVARALVKSFFFACSPANLLQ